MSKPHVPLLISLVVLSASQNFIAASIGVALPGIRSEFNISITQLAWINTGYFLPYVALMPFVGKIADMYSAKKVLLAELIIFLVGTIACARSNSFYGLVMGSLLQGVGTAGINPISMAAIQGYAPIEGLGTQMGIWQSSSTLIRFLGSVGSGWIIEISGWRILLWITLVLGVGGGVGHWPIQASIYLSQFWLR